LLDVEAEDVSQYFSGEKNYWLSLLLSKLCFPVLQALQADKVLELFNSFSFAPNQMSCDVAS
jgi:hypothetical protein